MDETPTRPSPRLNDLIAEEIRVILARRRLSASDLARMAGFTQRAISRRLTGEKVIDADDLQQIADALGVDVMDLMPQREGRLITVGGTSATTGRESKPWNLGLPKRPHPIGPPSRTAPAPSTSRTGRIGAALAAA
jgi:DNA-binding Xre family transcriptional regulator